jgi:hypothetical protein
MSFPFITSAPKDTQPEVEYHVYYTDQIIITYEVYNYSKASSNAADTFLKSGAFGKSALYEPNIIWDKWGYGNAAVETQRKQTKNYKYTVMIFIYKQTII